MLHVKHSRIRLPVHKLILCEIAGIRRAFTLDPWLWDRQLVPKCWFQTTSRHVITQRWNNSIYSSFCHYVKTHPDSHTSYTMHIGGSFAGQSGRDLKPPPPRGYEWEQLCLHAYIPWYFSIRTEVHEVSKAVKIRALFFGVITACCRMAGGHQRSGETRFLLSNQTSMVSQHKHTSKFTSRLFTMLSDVAICRHMHKYKGKNTHTEERSAACDLIHGNKAVDLFPRIKSQAAGRSAVCVFLP